ncbi:hypothetical protein CROQUDRAFT_99217 [Cronartium quercuum f. sp. fusiforme G11]|uniref:Uncharacterized protein n=1 Tax=Cronartium quercuum f. sp. fusiforme G11 TaxID=708437 RepID=A0A9P6T6Q1_9BASI|nr:hypothetical protein CROQUDRAFT_99217 [Cronartium quercuum f. sp. fusiforme G11]
MLSCEVSAELTSILRQVASVETSHSDCENTLEFDRSSSIYLLASSYPCSAKVWQDVQVLKQSFFEFPTRDPEIASVATMTVNESRSDLASRQSKPVTPSKIVNPAPDQKSPDQGALKLNHSPVEIPPLYTAKDELFPTLCRADAPVSPQTDAEMSRRTSKPFEFEDSNSTCLGMDLIGNAPTVAEVGGKVLMGTGGPSSGQLPIRRSSQPTDDSTKARECSPLGRYPLVLIWWKSFMGSNINFNFQLYQIIASSDPPNPNFPTLRAKNHRFEVFWRVLLYQFEAP